MAKKNGPELHEILKSLKQVKSISDELKWKESPENSSYLIGVADLYDNDGATITGLTFRCVLKKPVHINEVSYKFFIHHLYSGNNFRIFGLEVCNPKYISHRNKRKREEIRGPHYHVGCSQYMGHSAIVKQVKILLDSSDFEQWLKRFSRHANTNLKESIEYPYEFDLFGSVVRL